MEEPQVNFVMGLADLLKEHKAVLPTLPEMCDRLKDMASNETETQNFDRSRYASKLYLCL